MTKRGLALGGRSVRDILLGDRRVVDRIIAAIALTNPEQHGTGEASLAADIRWAVERGLRAAVSSLSGTVVDDELMLASAGRRFEEGSSFASVIVAYHRGVAVIWDELESQSTVEDADALRECARRLFLHLERISGALAMSYERAWTVSHLGERDARFAIFTALTQGGDPEREARRSGRSLAPGYGVLVVRLRKTSGTTPGDVRDHRATQRLRTAIESAGGPDVLAVLGAAGGTALLPMTSARETLPEVRRTLEAAFGDDCTGAWVEALVPDVGEALRVAEELIDIALVIREAGRVYTLDDLVLEYQSARPGPGRELLAGALEHVGDELLATIDAYLTSGGDRRATAAQLQVHPNTVDYRLGRVAALTGLDATAPEGSARLRAARVAHRLETH
ncbi:hypothetical protein SRABI76_02646 [Microbacterium oxydans]|uniref:PucR family transcriptional regulator n=1 Tax=Microbacterium oxydans TaxID=82380 RepID=UPI001DFCB642|nr:helix-turn-helix domain-containing protein [Microbacterium oxydans]CAH0226651.1 hypothetical protein SRABI76_02646 [Microbacterium oxydans]